MRTGEDVETFNNAPLAVGPSFNVVSAHAVTLRGYTETEAVDWLRADGQST